MTGARRIWFDVTYTRTQTGNVGITRTVRRLSHALQQMQAETHAACVPVAFHTDGFRIATAPRHPGEGSVERHASARLYRRLNAAPLRRFVSRAIPLPLVRAMWSLVNRWTFDALSSNDVPAAFGPDDWLVLADESWNYGVWDGALRAGRRGTRTLLVLYDLIPLRYPQFCAPLFTRVFREWLLRMLRCCDAVMCISRSTQSDLLAFCESENIRPPPTAHFRLGSDLPRSASGEVRATFGAFMAESAPLFSAVGTIEPRKNHSFLLNVFERLWSQGSEVRLLVIGRPHPDCQAVVDRLSSHEQLGRRLLFLPDGSDAEVDLAYTRSRALVFPSLAEGFGLPLVEARARGCRVLASNLPAFRELADDGVHFFGPSDAGQLAALVLDWAGPYVERPAPARPVTWDDSAAQFVAIAENLIGASSVSDGDRPEAAAP